MGDRLMVRHEAVEGSHRFVVLRGRDMKSAAAVQLHDPLSQTLGGTQLRFGAELTWYLERYLDYPCSAHRKHQRG